MRYRMIIFLIGVLSLASFSFAQDTHNLLQVRLTSSRLIEIEPGRIVTGSYVVTNNTDSEEEFLQNIRLPQGWRSIISYDYPIRVPARESTVRLITFIVPQNCPAGTYEIIYSVTSTKYPDLQLYDAFSVVVSSIVKLDSFIDEMPMVVMAGDECVVQVHVKNRGNGTTRTSIHATGTPGYPFKIEPAEFTLASGESDIATIRVATDSKLRNSTNYILAIEAESKDLNGGVVSVQQTAMLKILPRLAASIDQRHRVPSRMRFIALGNDTENGVQVEYSGSGSIDENGKRNVSFLFRGPDLQDRNIYGTRDEYRLSYSDPIMDIKAGDRVYALSPLSERLKYGRGGEAAVHPGNTKLGAFYVESRWQAPREQEIGAYVYQIFSDWLRIKGNYLNKRQPEYLDITDFRADIYTVQADMKLGSNNTFGLEYGYSRGDKNGTWEDIAHRVSLDGRLSPRFWYTFENIYAGPKYYGYYSDALFSSGTIAFPVYRNLMCNLSYRIYENNHDLDPAKNLAIREKSGRAVLSYQFSAGANVSLDYEDLRRRDDLDPSQFAFEQGTWRLGLGQSFRRFGVQSYSELATFKNLLSEMTSRDLDSYSVYAYYTPAHNQNYSAFAKFGHNTYTGEPDRTKSVGVTSAFRLSTLLSLSLTYNKNNFDSDKSKQQDIFLSTLDLNLPYEHILSFKARWISFNNSSNDYAVYASYTVPFDVPALRKQSVGALKGRIYDSDNPGAAPLSNVILSVNDYATATNQKGEFAFPALEPGSYSLWVDQKSMGMRNVSDRTLPLSVEIEGGQTTIQEIGISSACNISGTVAVFAYKSKEAAPIGNEGENKSLLLAGGRTANTSFDENDLEMTEALSHIPVEVSNGMERIRQLTDENGGFSFTGLRPGEWLLRIYDENMPQNHYVERVSTPIVLMKGNKKDIVIRVLPRIRSIKMLESKEIQ